MEKDFKYIPLDYLQPHPENPRKELGDLDELVASIKENGIYQNLTVVPHGMTAMDDDGNIVQGYRVIIGHRRMAAAKEAGLYSVPCFVVNMDYQTQLETMLLENMQRSDLTVYEQAQGFQQLLDFGSSIEEISQKTGFSQSTVRRRVKMTELDQVKLKNVSSRQINLMDFDELAKIEDLDERNSVLETIGTANFSFSVKNVLRKQQIKKNLPIVKGLLAQSELKVLTEGAKYSSKWERIGAEIDFWKWKENEWKEIDKEKILNSKAEAYYLDEYFGTLCFYVKSRRAKTEKVKLTKEEIDRKKALNDTWSEYKQMLQLHYEMRRDFVNKITYTEGKKMLVLQGALIASAVNLVNYGMADKKSIEALIGIDQERYDSYKDKKGFDFIFAEKNQKDFPKLVYYLFNDDASPYSSSAYEQIFPEYRPCWRMQALYAWLEALGYESSLEEQQLLDGTHEIFKRKEGDKA